NSLMASAAAQPGRVYWPSGLHVKPEGGLGGCSRWYWLLLTLTSTQQVGDFLPAGSPVASRPLELKLCTFCRAASTLALVGLSPAVCRAWVNSRAEVQPYTLKRSGANPEWVLAIQVSNS